MNMRTSSVVIGISHLAVFGYLAHAASKFGAIYADLYSPDTTLPVLTRIVLALAPVGWIVFGVAAAALLIGKDLVPSFRKMPNWPFAISLLAVGMGAVIALFLPLVVTITKMTTT